MTTAIFRRTKLARLCSQMVLALAATASCAALAAHAADTPTVDTGMDTSVAPGVDFNLYANGGWLKNEVMPDDKAYVGIFETLADEADAKVQAIIEKAVNAAPGSDERKIGDYYTAYMNVAAIDKLGLKPLKPEMDAINRIADKKALASYFGAHLRADVDPLNATNFDTDNLFGLWVGQEFHDHTKYTGYLMQGGLGLPDREFYVSDSPEMAKIRSAYLAHIAAMFKLANVPQPEQAAKRVFDLEMQIAKGHGTREESEDMHKADNKWTKADFDKNAPGMVWRNYFGAAGLAARPDLMVWHPGAVRSTAALVDSVPLATWKDYLRYHAISQHANVLPHQFFDEAFKLNAIMSGSKSPRPHGKYAIWATSGALGEVIGKLYVEQNFSPAAKAKVRDMVNNLLSAFEVQVNNISWMAPSTRAEALNKIKTFYVGVGYPDHWRDYSSLKISAADAYGNLDRTRLFNYHYAISKFGKPVDLTEWCMTPQTVNAVNMPLQNAINFPAAILQKPFFDPNGSDADNYGAIGSVIGHEISHSFDHTGSMIDGKGELRNWWTDEDLAHFEKATKVLVDQYSAYKPFPDLAENGAQTLDENIADLTGLNASLAAFHTALTKSGVAVDKAQDQAFFLAFAKAWRAKMRDAAMRSDMVSDGHALPQYRVLTVRNVDAWYDAFDIQPGQPLYLAPTERVRIW